MAMTNNEILYHTRAHDIIIMRCTMATTYHIASHDGNDNKNSGNDDNECRQLHIASRNGDDDNNNYWQQRTTSVGRRGLVRKRTTCGVA